ncbi:MAG: CRISPR system precrRNA processing endoribonuclease RAMP protein Cas6 [Bacillota bacterium]
MIKIIKGDKMMDLAAAKFTLTLEVLESMQLPPFKGSTFRGGFGHVFRRIACSQRQLRDCRGCLLTNACPYWALFEPGPPAGAEMLGKFEEIPRPFILEPPETEQTEFAPGARIVLNLVLAGKAMDYLPYFILVFKELGDTGIGKGRAKFRLEKAESVYPFRNENSILVYDGEKVYNRFHVITQVEMQDLPESNADTLGINFLTMTRLKSGGAFAEKPEFPLLIRALFRRISALQYFYCGKKLESDFQAAIARAEQVRLIRADTRWIDWERYSSRQDARMKLGGFVGQAEYAGEGWREFMDLLRWGELVHVGKGATFGLGRYEIS